MASPSHSNMGHDDDSPSQYIVVNQIEDLAKIVTNIKESQDHHQKQHIYVGSMDTHEIYTASSSCIERGQRRKHQICIKEMPTNDRRKLLNLAISVVYQGMFIGKEGYINGRISVSFSRILHKPLPPSDDNEQSSTTKDYDRYCYNGVDYPSEPLGIKPHQLQTLNTKTKMGQIVIHHDPSSSTSTSFVEPGLYEIVVTAMSTSEYSVRVDGTMADNAMDVLNSVHTKALKKQERIRQLGKERARIWTSMRLLERKINVVKDLINEAEAMGRRCEIEIADCDIDIENNIHMTDDELKNVHDKIKVSGGNDCE
mmetsp:Transcript_18180/g.26666  ORF Transcript_18180/g.26666 Transcript_18180/m.26666 type:complete len:312 (-) Transcript_18180:604-1539(-)|eukprot:CAMPEP_0195509068 /NCGR_PEP_ID=MMETSP0794_2-20130614/2101_1 /TAXON_ID=515487 /ORGANISM="Stephanopyxis turris, Strain CCMP 815" /LENGTH=311 /DNA_ID=CAMNT_0040636189 /DNA_START=49 /DNA_END=984 /DNA_ORIENTATION=+